MSLYTGIFEQFSIISPSLFQPRFSLNNQYPLSPPTSPTQPSAHRSSLRVTLSAPQDVMAWEAEKARPSAAMNTTPLCLIARPCHKSHGEKNVSHQQTASAGQAVEEDIQDGVWPRTNAPTKRVPPSEFLIPTVMEGREGVLEVGGGGNKGFGDQRSAGSRARVVDRSCDACPLSGVLLIVFV